MLSQIRFSVKIPQDERLGLVADPVIQAIGRPDFEDGLRTGTTVEVITDGDSVRTYTEVSVRLTARYGRFTAVCTQGNLDDIYLKQMKCPVLTYIHLL